MLQHFRAAQFLVKFRPEERLWEAVNIIKHVLTENANISHYIQFIPFH